MYIFFLIVLHINILTILIVKLVVDKSGTEDSKVEIRYKPYIEECREIIKQIKTSQFIK